MSVTFRAARGVGYADRIDGREVRFDGARRTRRDEVGSDPRAKLEALKAKRAELDAQISELEAQLGEGGERADMNEHTLGRLPPAYRKTRADGMPIRAGAPQPENEHTLGRRPPKGY